MEARTTACENAIRVVLASDFRPYCEGLERVFHDTADIELVASAVCAADALADIRVKHPDVLLLDMAMSNALSVAREAARLCKSTRIVALGVPEAETDVIACAEMGIVGYVSRSGSIQDAIAAIKAVARGEVHCSPKVAGFLFRRIAALSGERVSPDPVAGLTAREAQILRLLQQGLSNKMISRQLGIELPTVKNHIHRLLGKLGVHRRAEAVSLIQRKEHP
jgi:two-component system, NarL family, nitrate/nitrite response regulator NarL